MFGKIEKYTESDLVRLLKQSREPALKEIYSRYESRIFNYAFKFVQSDAIAAEITQDTFIKLWENREKLNENMGLAPWLFSVTKNSILNYIRNTNRLNNFKKEYSLSLSKSSNDTEEKIYMEEFQYLTNRAIALLPSLSQSIFNLSRTDGKSHNEIAEILGISPNAVRLQMVKSLKSIRKSLAVDIESPS